MGIQWIQRNRAEVFISASHIIWLSSLCVCLSPLPDIKTLIILDVGLPSASMTLPYLIILPKILFPDKVTYWGSQRTWTLLNTPHPGTAGLWHCSVTPEPTSWAVMLLVPPAGPTLSEHHPARDPKDLLNANKVMKEEKHIREEPVWTSVCHRSIDECGLGAISTGSMWTGGEERSEPRPRGHSRNSMFKRGCVRWRAVENEVGIRTWRRGFKGKGSTTDSFLKLRKNE